MSQVLLCQNHDGISLATDGRARLFHPLEEEGELMQVKKWFRLTPKVIAATVGAGYGIWLCEQFKEFIDLQGLWDFEEIAAAAIPFFRNGAEIVRRKSAYTPDDLNLDRIYIIIAGSTPQQDQDEFPFLLLASESFLDPVHVMPTTNVISIPRHLSIEARLARLTQADNTLEELESHLEKFLVRLAREDDGIGPPFHFLRITSDGINVRTRENL
jgi:hypothetical protein